jgi:hypothetical protein
VHNIRSECKGCLEGAGIISTELNQECKHKEHVIEIVKDPDGNTIITHDDSGKYHLLRGVNSGWNCCTTCLDCVFMTQNRMIYVCISFIITMIVLVYCIIDLIIIRALPVWTSSSLLTFILGLWAPNPGQGLLEHIKKPKKSPLKEPKKL